MKVNKMLGILFLVSIVFLRTAYAADIIPRRTGTIKITKPDGTVLTIGKDEVLPEISSGTIIEVLGGSIEVSPTEGFIQVVVAGSATIVRAGDRITASLDVDGNSNLSVDSGRISVIAGNTTITVKAGQEVRIGFDKRTGVVEVKSVKGIIETVTVGVKVRIPQDAVAKMWVDPETRKVYVESADGNVTVTSVNGDVVMLTKAESINTKGSAEMWEEVLPLPGEEPAEPELPEASPHRPAG